MQAAEDSSEPIALLAILRSAEADSDLNVAVRSLSGIRLETRIGRLADVTAKIVELRPPGLLLLDVQLDDAEEMALLERLIHRYAGVIPVFVTSAKASVEGVRRLMRLGIHDFIPQPITGADLLTAFKTATARPHQASLIARRANSVFSLIKPRGGMGATTLAVQMAHAIVTRKRNKANVCLLDLDIQYGNAALYLDMKARFTLEDMLDAPERLDGEFLRGLTLHHKSGIDVLPVPEHPIALDRLTPELVTRLLDVAAAEYDFVIVDISQVWTPWTKAALGRSDVIFQVVQMTVPALRQGHQQLELLREEGLGRIPTLVVANRYNRSLFGKDEIDKKEAEQALGQSIAFTIDNDYRTVSQALNCGLAVKEIDKRSTIGKQVHHLVETSIEMLTKGQSAATLNL